MVFLLTQVLSSLLPDHSSSTLHVHSGPGPVLSAGDAAVNKTDQNPHSVSLRSGGSGEPTGAISVNEWEVFRNAGKQGRGMGGNFTQSHQTPEEAAVHLSGGLQPGQKEQQPGKKEQQMQSLQAKVCSMHPGA